VRVIKLLRATADLKGISVVTDEGSAGRSEPTELPVVIDTSKAHQARIYDYWLGGKDNFAVDREAAEQALAACPGLRRGVRAQRAFLGNAVRYLAGAKGVRQFLDIGTGIPTANNTHEVAQAVDPQAHVVYVDNDPMVLAHARALLTAMGPGTTDYIDIDLRDTDAVLTAAARRVNVRSANPVTLRSRREVEQFFDGLELLDPGLVQVHRWRPGSVAQDLDDEVAGYAGLARKP
jgi:S-adenosyl methyltransferase